MKLKDLNTLRLDGWTRQNLFSKLEHLRRIEKALEPAVNSFEDREWMELARADIWTRKASIYQQLKDIQQKREILDTLLERAPDQQLRDILSYRVYDGLSWQQIAFRIGGGNTADAVKKRAQRYLEKFN